jgi:UDP-N-acetylmuramoyl-L-alanyl-D-glutamate--2,6-diaminopimelate ligase
MAAGFTNLSRDHLDYHATMEDYFAAKMRLFDEVVVDGGTGVIWADDAWSERAIAHVRQRGLRLMTVGAAGDTIRLLGREPGPLGQV